MTGDLIHIGCAGWSISSPQARLFGAGESQLARYATRFDVVEINSSFHRSHRPGTYARWADAVPRGFRFSVKLPRAITHDARLQGCGALLDAFAGEVAGLGAKLGGLLVQLPPGLVLAPRTASIFFAMLRRRLANVPVACEPRNASWFTPSAEALLQRHGVARVAVDPAPDVGAAAPGNGGAWRYWRLHGSPRMYYSAYGEARLRMVADALRAQARANLPVWCIFGNTAHGHAIEDAACLRALLGTSGGAPRDGHEEGPAAKVSQLAG